MPLHHAQINILLLRQLMQLYRLLQVIALEYHLLQLTAFDFLIIHHHHGQKDIFHKSLKVSPLYIQQIPYHD